MDSTLPDAFSTFQDQTSAWHDTESPNLLIFSIGYRVYSPSPAIKNASQNFGHSFFTCCWSCSWRGYPSCELQWKGRICVLCCGTILPCVPSANARWFCCSSWTNNVISIAQMTTTAILHRLGIMNAPWRKGSLTRGREVGKGANFRRVASLFLGTLMETLSPRVSTPRLGKLYMDLWWVYTWRLIHSHRTGNNGIRNFNIFRDNDHEMWGGNGQQCNSIYYALDA